MIENVDCSKNIYFGTGEQCSPLRIVIPFYSCKQSFISQRKDVMKKQQATEYMYASARISALETHMVGKERVGVLVEAKGRAEVAACRHKSKYKHAAIRKTVGCENKATGPEH